LSYPPGTSTVYYTFKEIENRLLTSYCIGSSGGQPKNEHQELMDEHENELGKKGVYDGTNLPVAHHLRYNRSHDSADRLWTAC
jgi:hypothetical protein